MARVLDDSTSRSAPPDQLREHRVAPTTTIHHPFGNSRVDRQAEARSRSRNVPGGSILDHQAER
ncbi:MAG: hypothetical protein EA387_10300 [Nitriliruptor sp.]|nr:MAG: hypothetical protein EA387_10300 [Nitriliruptor sp.]